jgi:hypothetical protein
MNKRDIETILNAADKQKKLSDACNYCGVSFRDNRFYGRGCRLCHRIEFGGGPIEPNAGVMDNEQFKAFLGECVKEAK